MEIDYAELVKTASEAYAVLQQTGLNKTLKEGTTKFTNWFEGLFTSRLHKEKIILMEQLSADGKALKMLQLELEMQNEENKGLQQEVRQRQQEFNEIRNNPDYTSILNIASSRLKNVVNAPITNVTGNINIGDVYNK